VLFHQRSVIHRAAGEIQGLVVDAEHLRIIPGGPQTAPGIEPQPPPGHLRVRRVLRSLRFTEDHRARLPLPQLFQDGCTDAAVAADTTGPGLSKRKIRNALIILGVLVFSKYFYIASMTNYFTFFLMDKFSMSVQGAQYALFAFLAASAAGTFIGGPVGDRIGRKYVIWGSILGAAPFTLMLPYAGLTGTIVLAVIIGLVISSAFSAILVYATDLMPGKVGMIAGVFFGLMFGLGGLGSAFFGWLADRTSIEFIFRVSTLLPLLGIITGFLPNIELKRDEK
jgi:FSR family fosmidomycin resistance protein-like MFS transporter